MSSVSWRTCRFDKAPVVDTINRVFQSEFKRSVATGSAVFLLVFTVKRSPVAATVAGSAALVLSFVPLTRRVISRIANAVSSSLFFLGTASALLLVRSGPKTKYRTGWQRSSRISRVTPSAMQKSDLSPAAMPLGRFAFFAAAFIFCADMGVGSLLPKEPGIKPYERIETTPGVRTGDIEHKVQSDGEHFYAIPTRDESWTFESYESETINWDPIEGRFTPDSSNDPEFVVAVIGGSSAFGIGQADTETLSNALAHRLRQHGLKVRVKNLGVIAWTSFQAAKDLRSRFENGEKYDLVVAYTGFNDLALGSASRRVPETLLTGSLYPSSGVMQSWADRSALARLLGREPTVRKPVVWRTMSRSFFYPEAPEDSSRASSMADDALYNLEAGFNAIKDASDENKTEFLWVMQPNWFESRVPKSQLGYGGIGEFEREFIGDNWAAIQEQFLKRNSSENIFDVRRVFDDTPCWIDFVHTRGVCSQMMADALVPSVRTILEEVREDRQ